MVHGLRFCLPQQSHHQVHQQQQQQHQHQQHHVAKPNQLRLLLLDYLAALDLRTVRR
jgi:hypothetical protein